MFSKVSVFDVRKSVKCFFLIITYFCSDILNQDTKKGIFMWLEGYVTPSLWLHRGMRTYISNWKCKLPAPLNNSTWKRGNIQGRLQFKPVRGVRSLATPSSVQVPLWTRVNRRSFLWSSNHRLLIGWFALIRSSNFCRWRGTFLITLH